MRQGLRPQSNRWGGRNRRGRHLGDPARSRAGGGKRGSPGVSAGGTDSDALVLQFERFTGDSRFRSTPFATMADSDALSRRRSPGTHCARHLPLVSPHLPARLNPDPELGLRSTRNLPRACRTRPRRSSRARRSAHGPGRGGSGGRGGPHHLAQPLLDRSDR